MTDRKAEEPGESAERRMCNWHSSRVTETVQSILGPCGGPVEFVDTQYFASGKPFYACAHHSEACRKAHGTASPFKFKKIKPPETPGFTPGPWTSTEDTLEIVTGFVSPENKLCWRISPSNVKGFGDDFAVAYVPNYPGRAQKHQQANARLIAAAPEMYELLKDYIEWHECAIPEGHRDDYEKDFLLERGKSLLQRVSPS